MRKSHIGYPKYEHGDVVRFSYDRGKGMIAIYEGTIVIVDAYGTIEQNEEPSYDILTIQKGKECLCKHVRESMIQMKGRLCKKN